MNFFSWKKNPNVILNLAHQPIEEQSRLEIFAQQHLHFDLIIDLGAALGTWSKQISKIIPGVPIIAVEPIPSFIQELHKIGILHSVIEGVVSESCGRREFFISDDLYSSSMLYEGSESLIVESHTLECVINKADMSPQSIFLKTDLQGLDFIAVQSAGKYLGNIEAIQMECQLAVYAEGMECLSSRIKSMAALGYEIFDVFSLLDRPSDGALGQLDILFVHQRSGIFHDISW